MRSSNDTRAMRERLAKAWARAVCPDDGPRPDEMRLELKLHAAEVALDRAIGGRDSGKILMSWIREAETGEKPERVDFDATRHGEIPDASENT
jgi:hypothetical protein